MAHVNRKTHDVIIIGAGSIGTPTAFFLAKAGLRVLVLDMYPSAGQASNKHAIGGIRATHSDLAKIYLGQESLKIFSTWKERTGDNIEWHQGGYSFIAYDQPIAKTLTDLVQWQTDHHLIISWLDREDLLDLIPTINPDGLLGGTYSPEDGCASPLKSAFSFHHQAKKIGAEFHFNEQVLDFIVKKEKIKGVTTNNGVYTSDIVINAAGGWAKELSGKLDLDVPVEPDSHEAAITEPVKRFFHPMIVDMRSRPGSQNFYFYQHVTGKIIFCMTPDPPIFGNHTIASSNFLPRASRRLIDVMPVLKDIRVRRVWRGTYPMTPDGSPIIGKVDGLDGYLLAVGMCGQGFMLGPGIAELLTRLILNDINKTDRIILENLSFHRNFNQEELLK